MSDETTLLADVGEALYGSRWQTDLAGELGVSDRTVRRWLAEPNAVPAGAWTDILQLMDRRTRLLASLKHKIVGAQVLAPGPLRPA